MKKILTKTIDCDKYAVMPISPTNKEAQFNFQKRKEKQIKILSARLDEAKDALKAINVLINGNIVNVKN